MLVLLLHCETFTYIKYTLNYNINIRTLKADGCPDSIK